MEPLVLLFGLLLAGLILFVIFVVAGYLLRFVAGLVGIKGVTLRYATFTALLAALAGAFVTVPLALVGWKEPFSLWILGVVVQGAVIRSRFSTGLVAAILIALVVTIVWVFVSLMLGTAGSALLSIVKT